MHFPITDPLYAKITKYHQKICYFGGAGKKPSNARKKYHAIFFLETLKNWDQYFYF